MSYDNPNFTIITPGGCNSFCSFCTEPFKQKPSPDYLANLVAVLDHGLPTHFRQVSISGGEPTLSPALEAILTLVQMSGRFDKVVLTTNGARLMQYVDLFKDKVNHLNVSRHAIGYEANTKVFGTRNIVTDEDLKKASFELNKAGVDVNLNFVYGKDSQLTVDYVLQYIDYAKSVGATSVSFRYDQNENSLEPTYLEKLFEEWVKVRSGGCPVCRNHTVLVGGFPVVFKASFAEPSKAIDDVYELVYHITGKLTTDWEGKRDFTPAMAQAYVRDFQANPHKQHEVVAHTVAAPNTPVKGQRSAPRTNIPVTPPARATAAGRTAAPKFIPVASVDAVGGGCGFGGFGGGCGKSQDDSTALSAVSARPSKTRSLRQTPPLTTSNYGGGCGGGCGS